jgi:hypothetical protein
MDVPPGSSGRGDSMRRDFIPHWHIPNAGRCRVCDLPYFTDNPPEVKGHRAFHKRYLRALENGWAPYPEEVREQIRDEAFAILKIPGASFEERLAAAEKFLLSKFHEYLFGVLLNYPLQTAPGRDIFTYFTLRIEEKGLLKQFGQDVAEEMSREYSDHPVR